MTGMKTAVIGLGATGTVAAAALLGVEPETVLAVSRPEAAQRIKERGLKVGGALEFQAPAKNIVSNVEALAEYAPDAVIITTKTFSLDGVLASLARIQRPGMMVVSAHNGLGPEDLVAQRLGADSAFRMSLNYGVALAEPGHAEVAFFNRPNFLGGLDPAKAGKAQELADLLTQAGLETQFVDDIKLFIWRKMIIKCTMAAICAVTDRTIAGGLDYPPTREIADACFAEALAVAKAEGYDLGPDYLEGALAYLAKVGAHRDSMCHDFAAKRPTEIDFLGAKIVEYGRKHGIATPYFSTMTNLVKAIEDGYLNN